MSRAACVPARADGPGPAQSGKRVAFTPRRSVLISRALIDSRGPRLCYSRYVPFPGIVGDRCARWMALGGMYAPCFARGARAQSRRCSPRLTVLKSIRGRLQASCIAPITSCQGAGGDTHNPFYLFRTLFYNAHLIRSPFLPASLAPPFAPHCFYLLAPAAARANYQRWRREGPARSANRTAALPTRTLRPGHPAAARPLAAPDSSLHRQTTSKPPFLAPRRGRASAADWTRAQHV